MALSALGDHGHDLVMLAELQPQRIVKGHSALGEGVRHQSELPELSDYLTGEAGEVLLCYLNYLRLTLLAGALKGAHENNVSGHGSHQELARDEVLLSGDVVLDEAVGLVDAGNGAAGQVGLVRQPQTSPVLDDGALLLQLFNCQHKLLEVEAPGVAHTLVELLEGQGLFARTL